MRTVRLHDTRSGQLRELVPRDQRRVGIYACGPTVYSRIHIGNARPFVLFSLLKRFLEHEGYAVTLVINVTDVNDKIYAAVHPEARTGTGELSDAQPASVRLARQMTELYRRDTDGLRLGRPDHEPLASETIGEIVDYIETLIERGHAYQSGGDVYFSVRSDPGYGSLSHRRLDDMDQGEGRGGSTVAGKRDPLDFALWKGRKEDEDTWWSSPWGDGRPGWHIECSAMAESLLGVGFDIHGGGSDLVFPHHENEAAQTRAARGAELASIWMHNGMIQSTGEKMGKSLGNIRALHEVTEQVERAGGDAHRDWDGHAAATVVMYLIAGHYRQPLAFSKAELLDAERRVLRIRGAIGHLRRDEPSPEEMAPHRDAFFDALAEDFNTPRALSHLFEWVREANRSAVPVGDQHLREMLEVLGMGGMEGLVPADVAAIDQEAVELAGQRERARRERDFARADELRAQIRMRGWEVRDAAGGSELIPVDADA
ncbi:MAG: cysteine--tRNA ligase [Solirubrobacteraceae bacterium]